MPSKPRVAILVGASPERMPPLRIPRGSLLVAVDGGVRACRRNQLAPDLAVGDWDSLGLTPKGWSLTLPRDKDRSDFYFALGAAYAAGAREFVAYGVTGARPDHHLAALQDLAELAARLGVRSVEARDARGTYWMVRGEWRKHLRKGDLFSVLAWPATARGVSITGAARYRISPQTLAPGSRGLSNVALGGEVRIAVRGGGVLVFIAGLGEGTW